MPGRGRGSPSAAALITQREPAALLGGGQQGPGRQPTAPAAGAFSGWGSLVDRGLQTPSRHPSASLLGKGGWPWHSSGRLGFQALLTVPRKPDLTGIFTLTTYPPAACPPRLHRKRPRQPEASAAAPSPASGSSGRTPGFLIDPQPNPRKRMLGPVQSEPGDTRREGHIPLVPQRRLCALSSRWHDCDRTQGAAHAYPAARPPTVCPSRCRCEGQAMALPCRTVCHVTLVCPRCQAVSCFSILSIKALLTGPCPDSVPTAPPCPPAACPRRPRLWALPACLPPGQRLPRSAPGRARLRARPPAREGPSPASQTLAPGETTARL